MSVSGRSFVTVMNLIKKWDVKITNYFSLQVFDMYSLINQYLLMSGMYQTFLCHSEKDRYDSSLWEAHSVLGKQELNNVSWTSVITEVQNSMGIKHKVLFSQWKISWNNLNIKSFEIDLLQSCFLELLTKSLVVFVF